MRVIKIEETKSSPAIIHVSWFNKKGQQYGYFLTGSTLKEVEEVFQKEFFSVFSELANSFAT